jgi:hypothetical protein
MGSVFLAEDPELGRKVALKVPHFNGPPEAQTAARRRFLREARAAAAVRHPHVCPIYDVGEQDGTPFVVMAFIEGSSLAERLQREGHFADCRTAAALAVQVAEGLAAVHDQGLIHRDLKPGNILLDQNGAAYLTDFGLARWQDDAEYLTAEGAVVGTPAYMAPEQVSGDFGPVTARSDLYSLGVILYQMVTGSVPFAETERMRLLCQILMDDPPPPRQLRPDLDPALEGVILKAMARRPEERFADARALAAALREWLASAGDQPPPAGTVNRPGPAQTAPPRSRPPWRWAMVAGVVMLLGAVGYLALKPLLHRGSPEAADDSKATVAPLTAKLDVRVWKRADTSKGLTLGSAGALPLRAGDHMRVEAETDRPAYLYVIYLDAQGEASPLFPWRKYNWDGRRAEEKRDRLRLPEDPLKDAAPLEPGPSGIEAVLLLARDEPLSAEEVGQLRRLFKKAPPGRFDPLRGAVWLGAEERFTEAHDRARPNLDQSGTVLDSVERMRRLVRGELKGLAGDVRGVCYPFEGK